MIGNDEFGQILIGLYKQQRFYHILTILPPFEELVYLIPSIRLIVALTLFRLGRYKAGLRELAIAIEMEPESLEKERLVHYQVKLLQILKLEDRVGPCRSQINDLRHTRKLLTPNAPTEVDLGSLDLQVDLDPIHVQALAYIDSGGILNEYSIGNLCMVVNDLVCKFVGMFCGSRAEKDPLEVLFHAIKYLGPSYLYQPILDHKRDILSYMKNELAKVPELDLSMDIKSLVMLLVRLEASSSNSVNQLASLIVKHQLIIGFLKFLDKQYKEALTYLIWVLQFISVVDIKLAGYIDKTEYLSYLPKRIACVVLTKCIEFGDIKFSVITLKGIHRRLMEDSPEINITSELSSSRLFQSFISCGILHEKLAFECGKLFEIGETTIHRFDPENVETMVRNYIVACALTPQHDYKILVLLDKILLGLLMYGGIHLQAFWFFSTVKNYLQLTLDFGPIHYHSRFKYELFAHEEIQYKNYHDILNRMNEISCQISDEEIMDLWETTNGESLLLPIVFTNENKLLLMDGYFDESSSVFNKENLVVNGYNVQLKLKGQCKLASKIIEEKFDMSREFIELWKGNYLRYQGAVPGMILRSVNNME